jgi:hypothetical protein
MFPNISPYQKFWIMVGANNCGCDFSMLDVISKTPRMGASGGFLSSKEKLVGNECMFAKFPFLVFIFQFDVSK